MDLYCCWSILLFSKLYLGLKIILQLDWAGKNKKKLPKNNEIFADFALRIRNRFKLRKRSESERILKIAKRKRSEVKSILCEAKRSEFASLRTFSQSCEFALRIWSPDLSKQLKFRWSNQSFCSEENTTPKNFFLDLSMIWQTGTSFLYLKKA